MKRLSGAGPCSSLDWIELVRNGAPYEKLFRTGANRMIHISRSVVGAAELEAMGRVMRDDGYLGMGREVRAFEAELQEYLGGRDRTVICLNSGTAALHLAVQALTSPGDEVLVQSLTFMASFQAISAAGAVPVACEVYPDTVTLDLEDAARRITPRTKAVMPVHYASNPGDLEAIYGFAERHGLRVIEDAAHAFGCTYKGRKIGSFGDLACFSFDGLKNITSGEGGAVVTSDPEVIQWVQDARLLGVQRDTEKRYQGARSWEFDVQHQGYRYHLSNLFAAVGRVQLGRFEGEFKPRRLELAQKYRTAFAGTERSPTFPRRSRPDCPPYVSHPGAQREAGWAASIFAGAGD